MAGFIGSPPMNLVEGTAANGSFVAPGVSVPCPHSLHGTITLGVRPEDCRLRGGNVKGMVYGVAPTGDVTCLTNMVGTKKVEVKAARDFWSRIDVPIGTTLDPARLYFFDDAGQRSRGAA